MTGNTIRIRQQLRDLEAGNWIGEQVFAIRKAMDEFDLPELMERLQGFEEDSELHLQRVRELRGLFAEGLKVLKKSEKG